MKVKDKLKCQIKCIIFVFWWTKAGILGIFRSPLTTQKLEVHMSSLWHKILKRDWTNSYLVGIFTASQVRIPLITSIHKNLKKNNLCDMIQKWWIYLDWICRFFLLYMATTNSLPCPTCNSSFLSIVEFAFSFGCMWCSLYFI